MGCLISPGPLCDPEPNLSSLISFMHGKLISPAPISVYDCGYPTIAYRMFKTYHEAHHNQGDEGAAYLAACCRQLQKHDEYLKYLNIACQQNPAEARKVLGEYFPTGMDPKDYFDYERVKE